MKKNLNLDPDLQIFEYYIPYQTEETQHYKWLINQPYITMIKTGRSINDTITKLLNDIPDTEMIFWAIDDRIPYFINENAFYQIWLKVNELNVNHTNNNIGRISLGSVIEGKINIDENKLISNGEFKIGEICYHGYSQNTLIMRFWEHHYIQSKILKYIFINSGVSKESGPGVYSYLLKKISLMNYKIPKNYKEICNRNFFPIIDDSFILFYESTKGRENKSNRPYIKNNIPIVLRYAKKLLVKHNLDIPKFGLDDTFTGGLRGDKYLISIGEK